MIANDIKALISGGIIKDYKAVYKFGEANINTSMLEVWQGAGTVGNYTFLTAATTLEAISSSANDTAAGTGARTITIYGLNSDFEEIEETITMNGTTVTASTTASFLRVNRAQIATTGTYSTNSTNGSNQGNIQIRATGGGTVLSYIANSNGYGESQQAIYTIPAGYKGFFYELEMFVDSTKAVDLYAWRREQADVVAAPFSSKRLLQEFKSIGGLAPFELTFPIAIPEKSDVWLSTKVASGTAEITASFVLLLIKNELFE